MGDLRSLKPDQPDKAFGFDPKCPSCPAPAIEPVTTHPEQTSVGTYFMAGAGIGVILIICWAFYKPFRTNRESTPSASPRVRYSQLPEKETSPATRGLTPR